MSVPKKKRRTKRDYEYLGTYINKVLKQVHPSGGITGEAEKSVNVLLMDTLDRTMKVVNDLLQSSKTHTVKATVISAALSTIITGELGKHAKSEGTKSVTKFQSSVAGTKGAGVSKASRAGLKFPPTRIGHMIRERASGCSRLSETASITMAAALEYLAAEVLELAGNSAYDHKHKLINNRDILLAISNDFELHKLYKNVVLPGGVVPFYIPTEKDKKKKRKK